MPIGSEENATDDERMETIRMLRDSATAFLGADLGRIRRLRFLDPGFDRAIWREMCALGWLGLRVPEAHGGLGFGMQEYSALAVELGSALAPEPLVLVGLSVRCLPEERLPAVLSGARIVLPAWQEQPGVPVGAPQRTVFDGRKLTGEKHFVMYAGGADAFLVTTASGLALVDASAPGVSLKIGRTQDGGHYGTIRFDGAEAMPIPDESFDDAVSDATLATAAYLLGVAERAFRITIDYLKIRRQFGKPIGAFQALQHRAVDLCLELALLRASVESAAAIVDSGVSRLHKQAAVSRAKARASRCASLVCREAIQLHGAIGYTDEADIGLFLRKAMTLINLFGSERAHRTRYLALTKTALAAPAGRTEKAA